MISAFSFFEIVIILKPYDHISIIITLYPLRIGVEVEGGMFERDIEVAQSDK